MSDTDNKKARIILSEMASLNAVLPENYEGCEAEYLGKLRVFLEGQDFLKLGYAIEGGRWEIALMNINKMRKKTEELQLLCFEKYLKNIKGAVLHKSRSESLQIMTKITAKRVQLRNILGKEEFL